MTNRIMQVYFGNNCFPYKDKERKVAYPIIAKVGGGSLVCGENNTTTIRFYTTRIGGLSNTWVANLKLPNGKPYFRILQNTGVEEDEFYVDLDISDLYTQIQGEVIIGLNGYTGEISITEEDDDYRINGTPSIVSTYVVKVMVNYAPIVLPHGDLDPSDFQQLLALIATKLNITTGIVVIDEDTDLTQFESGQVLLAKDTGKLYTYNGTDLVEFELDLLNFAKTNKANVFTETQKLKGATLEFEGNEESLDYPSGKIETNVEDTTFDITAFITMLIKSSLGAIYIESGEDENVIINGTIIPKNIELQPKLIAGQNITIIGNVISATGGGSGGAVDSVNGKTGVVVLTAEDMKIAPQDVRTTKQVLDNIYQELEYINEVTPNDVSASNKLATANDIQDVREVAEGKCKTFILQYSETDPASYDDVTFPANKYQKFDGTPIDTKEEFEEYVGDLGLNSLANSRFNSQSPNVIVNDFGLYIVFCSIGVYPDFNGKKYIVKSNELSNVINNGDVILIIETDVPDRWFAGSTPSSYFYKLETTKVDLTNYAKTNTVNTFTQKQTFNGGVEIASGDLKIGSTTYAENSIQMRATTTTDSSSTTYSGTLTSNQEKVFTQPLTSLTITGLTQASGDDLPRYECSFVVGANMTITLPSGVVWKMGTPTLVVGDSWTLYIKGGFAYLC